MPILQEADRLDNLTARALSRCCFYIVILFFADCFRLDTGAIGGWAASMANSAIGNLASDVSNASGTICLRRQMAFAA